MTSSAEKALDRLCESAGKDAETQLRLLQKLLGNIKSNPAELKFRRLQTTGRISDLLRYKGAGAFLKSAGFAGAEGDVLEWSPSAAIALTDALLALDRRTASLSEAKQREAIQGEAEKSGEMYRAAVSGGARGAGRKELETLVRSPAGQETLKLLEKVLSNVYRYPTTDQYKSVNLSKGAGEKLRAALPLLKLAGFVERKDNGEDRATMIKNKIGEVQRILAMLHWVIHPEAVALKLPASPAGTPLSRSLGALLGMAIGDALGAPLEMTGRSPLGAEEVDRAMEMCGGGHWGVGPGQVTDDTELSICLAESLAKSGAAAGYNANDACFRYSQWYMTKPFDVSTPIKNAFRIGGSSSDMERRSLTCNKESQNNGALMRSVPLGVWGAGRRLNVPQLVEAAKADARLSHPSNAATSANAAYVLAVAELVRSGKAPDAIRSAMSWVEDETKKSNDLGGVDAWLQEAVASKHDLSDAFGAGLSDDIGSAKWGFVHAFRHLQLGSSFEDAMRATLAGGGDTDTNAAIVGGMIGATVGIQGIPERWLRAVLVGTGEGERSRPSEVHPARLPKLAEELYAYIA